MGWAAGPAPLPSTPGVKPNTGTSPLGGPHFSVVNLISRGSSGTSPRSRPGPAGTPAPRWQSSCGVAGDSPGLTPVCCLLIFSPYRDCSQGARWPWPPPGPLLMPPRLPSPSTSPGAAHAPSPAWLQAAGSWHGLQLTFSSTGSGEQGQREGREEQPHPGQPRAQPSCDCVGWSAAAVGAPESNCLLSLPRLEKTNRPRSERTGRGRDTLPPTVPPPGEFWAPHTRGWLQEPLAVTLLPVTSQPECDSDTGSERRGGQWARARTQF